MGRPKPPRTRTRGDNTRSRYQNGCGGLRGAATRSRGPGVTITRPVGVLHRQALAGPTYADPETGITHVRVRYASPNGRAMWLKSWGSTTFHKQAKRAAFGTIVLPSSEVA
jgi:hypothetical protein